MVVPLVCALLGLSWSPIEPGSGLGGSAALSFVENRGQWERSAVFVAERGPLVARGAGRPARGARRRQAAAGAVPRGAGLKHVQGLR